MAKMTIKATYSIDRETDQRLRELAERWGQSKSTALRWAIKLADEHADQLGPDRRISPLEAYQTLLDKKELGRSTKAWEAAVQATRQDWHDDKAP